jgi:uncharacterized protein (TIGR02266 family)
MSKERRRDDRIDTSIDVDYSTYSSYHLRKITNVSKGGLYIRTQEPPPVGTDLEVRFKLPDQKRELNLSVKVAWTYKQPETVALNSSGMGVQFNNISDEDLKTVIAFVEKQQRK